MQEGLSQPAIDGALIELMLDMAAEMVEMFQTSGVPKAALAWTMKDKSACTGQHSISGAGWLDKVEAVFKQLAENPTSTVNTEIVMITCCLQQAAVIHYAPLRRAAPAVKRNFGEVSEWPKEHAWKVCIRKRIEGSNPSLTATFKNPSAESVAGFFAFLAREKPCRCRLSAV